MSRNERVSAVRRDRPAAGTCRAPADRAPVRSAGAARVRAALMLKGAALSRTEPQWTSTGALTGAAQNRREPHSVAGG